MNWFCAYASFAGSVGSSAKGAIKHFADAGEKVTGVGPLQQFGFETGVSAPFLTLVLSQRRMQ